MEHIRQALQRASDTALAGNALNPTVADSPRPVGPGPVVADAAELPMREIELRHRQLEPDRIVAHDNADPRAKSFDMLRTQVLQAMDLKEWQILAVTSPSAECGKTLTAVNLALSIARQRERSVLLVDMDLQKPQVANRLKIPGDHGLVEVLEGKAELEDALKCVRIGNLRLPVLPCEKSVLHSSELMASNAMSSLLRGLKQSDKSRIIILDLPPMLVGDDVLSILPLVDCVLFVAAVGTSTATDIRECNKHLQSTTVVRIVLNKVAEAGNSYYYY